MADGRSTNDKSVSPSRLAAYGDLFERMLDVVLLLDPTSHIVLEANPACERTLGLAPEKLVGRTLGQWIDDPSPSEFGKALRVAMRRYHPRQFQAKWKASEDRQLTLEVLACPLNLANDEMVLQLVLRDVTFQREAEAKIQSFLQELRIANEKLEQLTIQDEMTGLYNFRHLKSALAMEHARSVREARPYSVVFCDIDHFKRYNDRNGHPAGDDLLREFANVLRNSCRMVDTVARYGGEEFVVIGPNTHSQGSMILAERIRAAVESHPFKFGEFQPLGKVTISVGVATCPDHARDPENLLAAADQALYLSKQAGRNRVSLAIPLLDSRKPAA